MFGLFKKVTIAHPALGPLTRSGQQWEGKICLTAHQPIPLEIDGSKDEPHPAAAAAAMQLANRLPALRPVISQALLEHLEPYQEALADQDSGYAEMLEQPEDRAVIAAIRSPEDAWNAADPAGVEIGLEGGKVRLLIKFRVIWDIEHVLGAYFDDWEFMELNGSV